MQDGGASNQTYKFTVTPDYFREAAQPGPGGMRFSRTEITQILISVSVLTLAFGIALMGGVVFAFQDIFLFGIVLLAAFFAVSTGFLFHELAHKRVAQKYGCIAEYRMSMQGLLLAVITSMVGFLFALPGAVMIRGRIDMRQNGMISIAGPATNMAIGGVAFALEPFFTNDAFVFIIVQIVAQINLWLAVFNMLPVPPLDGSKVFMWNKGFYILAMALAIILLAMYFLYPASFTSL